MINAWSLLYDEINGTMDETYPIKKRDKMTDKNKDDITLLGGDSDTVTFTVPEDAVGAADTISIDFGGVDEGILNIDGGDTLDFRSSGLPGAMGEDHIDFSGFAGTAYDDPKYFVVDPQHLSVGLGNTASESDGLNLNVDPDLTVGVAETLNLNINTKPHPDLKYKSQKYQEDKGIKDLKDYVASTYRGHYTNKNSDTQTLDLIHSVGDAESFCRSNALKYLSRYDKKGSAKQDILKAMHYCLLLYYFNGNTQEPDYTNTRYETF
tara:strand:- start:589 stop:1383 length:795 start_codon:yes stop_codon:yes gene_type:complete